MWKKWQRYQQRKKLTQAQYQFLLDEYPHSPHSEHRELVSIDCETTGLDVEQAEIIAIAAVKIRGNQILCRESFSVLVKPEKEMLADNISIHGLRPKDLSQGLDIQTALHQLLLFIGNRPLVGYYLEFDVAMINKFLKPMIGITLPNQQIEVSSLYYRQVIDKSMYSCHVDLRWDSMCKALGVPTMDRHNALNDAIQAALMYLSLDRKYTQHGPASS